MKKKTSFSLLLLALLCCSLIPYGARAQSPTQINLSTQGTINYPTAQTPSPTPTPTPTTNPTPTTTPTPTPSPTASPTPTPRPTATPSPTPTPTPTPSPTPTANPNATSLLHVSGTNILDSDNNVKKLRGTALYGSYYWSKGQSITQSDFTTLTSHGCNLIDITGVLWGEFETGDGVWSSSSFAYLDNILNLCKANHVYCIVTGAGISLSVNGNGEPFDSAIPPWIWDSSHLNTAKISASQFENNFFNLGLSSYNSVRQEYVDFWNHITARYATNPYFLIDFFNEPYNGNTINSNANQAQSANYANTITWLINRITNYNNPLVVDHPWVNTGLTFSKITDVSWTNMIWEGHQYFVEGSDTVSSWEGAVTAVLKPYSTTFGKPISVGEYAVYGGSTWAPTNSGNWWTETQGIVNWMNTQGFAGFEFEDYLNLYPYSNYYTQTQTTNILNLIFVGNQ